MKRKLWLVLPTAIVVGILNVLCFFLFMVAYSYLLDPGHDQNYYQDAANRFGPYSSIICGMPLMYLAGRWIGKRVGPQLAVTGALLVWAIYFVLDLTIVAASGALMSILWLFVISFATQVAAVYLGGRHAQAKAVA